MQTSSETVAAQIRRPTECAEQWSSNSSISKKAVPNSLLAKRPSSAVCAPGLRLQRILVTTDFSDASNRALPFATALVKRFGAEVKLLHVLEPPPPIAGWESVVLESDDHAIGLVYGDLDSLANRAFGDDTVVNTHVRTGKPWQEIIKAADELSADLLVIATHGYTGLKHTLLGSTAERVIRHSPCPVLVVRGHPAARWNETGNAVAFNHIVLATDLSSNSFKAFPAAQALSKEFGANVTLMHVVEGFPIEAILRQEITRTTFTRVMSEARERMNALSMWLRNESGFKAAIAVRFGIPFVEITNAAKGLRDSLIVLATHGYTGLQHMCLGSVAEDVVRHADCPVLVVR